MRDRRQLGLDGENAAARTYERLGYVVLDRRWRTRHGELDLVVARDGTVVFCEVKTRSSDRYGTAAQAVGPEKQRRIRRLAVAWLANQGRRFDVVRFDVAAVRAGDRGDAVDIIEGAF